MWKPIALVAIGAVAALTLAGCAEDPAASAGPAAVAGAYEAAVEAAKRAADGQDLEGQKLSILGVLGDAQLEAYMGTLAPFEEATGIDITYEGTRDAAAVLQTRIAGGNPPDLVSNSSAGQMRQLASDGELIALDDFVDVKTVREQYPAGLVDLATVDGSLYGIQYNSGINGLIWYDPNSYDGPVEPATWGELSDWADGAAAAGTTPWCIGVESGAASGWPGGVWVEQMLLQEAGPDVFAAWGRGELSWLSPEVKTAFERFGEIVHDPALVSGGPETVLSTNFATSANGMYTDPVSCFTHLQGDWLGAAVAGSVPGVEPVTDIDFFAVPPIDPAFAGSVETSGEMLGLLVDSPAGQAFMRYVATPEFSTMVAGTGQWIGANTQVPAEAYTTELSRKAATLYATAEHVQFAAQSEFPVEVQSAFFSAVVSYIGDAATLDASLANLETLRTAAR